MDSARRNKSARFIKCQVLFVWCCCCYTTYQNLPVLVLPRHTYKCIPRNQLLAELRMMSFSEVVVGVLILVALPERTPHTCGWIPETLFMSNAISCIDTWELFRCGGLVCVLPQSFLLLTLGAWQHYCLPWPRNMPGYTHGLYSVVPSWFLDTI